VLSRNGERGARNNAFTNSNNMPCTPIHAGNPGPVPIAVPAIVISVVMGSVVIRVISPRVIISRQSSIRRHPRYSFTASVRGQDSYIDGHWTS
jgi:hypothetical protein